jgi:hypothetical protein
LVNAFFNNYDVAVLVARPGVGRHPPGPRRPLASSAQADPAGSRRAPRRTSSDRRRARP